MIPGFLLSLISKESPSPIRLCVESFSQSFHLFYFIFFCHQHTLGHSIFHLKSPILVFHCLLYSQRDSCACKMIMPLRLPSFIQSPHWLLLVLDIKIRPFSPGSNFTILFLHFLLKLSWKRLFFLSLCLNPRIYKSYFLQWLRMQCIFSSSDYLLFLSQLSVWTLTPQSVFHNYQIG